jgi:hypothetical protein
MLVDDNMDVNIAQEYKIAMRLRGDTDRSAFLEEASW